MYARTHASTHSLKANIQSPERSSNRRGCCMGHLRAGGAGFGAVRGVWHISQFYFEPYFNASVPSDLRSLSLAKKYIYI